MDRARRKVMLIQPPLEDFYTTPIRLYPLALLYVARVFELFGWEVRILDCLSPLKKRKIPLPEKLAYLRPYLHHPYFFKHYYRFGLSKEEIIEAIKKFSPDLIGLNSAFAAYYRKLEEVAQEIKKNFSGWLIVGGHQASCFPGEIKSRTPAIDEVITGQAEISLPAFLKNNFPPIRPDRNFANNFFQAEGIDRHKFFDLLEKNFIDWKTIWPAHELINPDFYKIGRKNYATLQASRGCPFRCTFCNIQIVFGHQPDYRPVNSVIEEMRFLFRQRQVEIFNFEDDNLSLDRDWFEEFLKAVIGDEDLRGTEILAMNGLNYETLDERILSLMKQAGFRKLDLPLVSGRPEIRKSLKRPEKKGSDFFWEIIRLARRLGFAITVYLIIGLPGQTEEEIRETAQKLWEEGVVATPSIFYLAPGSELYKTLAVPEEIRSDWDMYRSTAFAIETENLSREKLINLFLYFREKNLARRWHAASG